MASMNWWMLAGTTAAVGVAALLIIKFLQRNRRRRRKLVMENYETDLVYVFNFPSCRSIVSISPFGLKLETWLRLRKIRHVTTRKLHVWSSKNQIPFIELNGREINESNLIMKELAHYFNVGDQEWLTGEEMGQSRAISMMLENRTVQSYFYYRYVDDVSTFIDQWEFVGPWFRSWLKILFPFGHRGGTRSRGMDKEGVQHIYDLGIEDLRVLSEFLGDKKFLFGDEMMTADCYAFGHLSQILYLPVDYPHQAYLRTEARNLCDYTDRIRDLLWPDWYDICEKYCKGDCK